MSETVIYGRNAVLEAIKAGRDIEELLIQQGEHTGSLKQIVAIAREKNLRFKTVPKEKLDELSENSNHQAVCCIVSDYKYSDWHDCLQKARENGKTPFIVICENIQDPHNLGAILRTCDACSVDCVIIPENRSVGVTSAAVKTAAGACEYVPVCRVKNIARTVDELKKENIWTACADMDGTQIYKTDLTGPIALVVGGEHEGISRLVREKCDYIISLPMFGQVTSLNASVAAAVSMFEIVRQRLMK